MEPDASVVPPLPDGATPDAMTEPEALDGSASDPSDNGGCSSDDECVHRADDAFCLRGACVACRTHADCTDPAAPECSSAGTCVACTDDDACKDRDGTAYCARSGAQRGACVECLADNHCGEPDAPECKPSGMCGPCLSDEACEGREGLSHCHQRPDTPTFAHCVACTAETEADDCGTSSCIQSTGACSTTPRGTRKPCESCEADSECVAGAQCLLHMLHAKPLGYFCFYRFETFGGCADTVAEAAPYSLAGYDTSIDGSDSAEYCKPVTSCQAIDDASAARRCSADEDCGTTGWNDGVCSPAGQCTYACSSAFECAGEAPSCKFPNETDPKQCSRLR